LFLSWLGKLSHSPLRDNGPSLLNLSLSQYHHEEVRSYLEIRRGEWVVTVVELLSPKKINALRRADAYERNDSSVLQGVLPIW